MRYRLFCVFAAFMLLVGILTFLKFSPAGATYHSTTQSHTFNATGHNLSSPKMVDTSTTPQTKGTLHGTVSPRPAPGGRNHVPAPQHVARLTPPPVTALSTKTSFEGQDNTGWTPSDSNGAGGLNNYLETVNEQFEVYSRTGTPQYGTSFNTWFGQSGSLFDPKTVWDNTGKRFIFLVDTGSSLLVSVAQQTSGTGNYCNYGFPTLSNYFADYPQLGVDADGIYFSANLYPNSGAVIPQLFFANRSEMESCQSTSYTYWTGLTNPDGSYAFTIVPSVEHSSGNGIEYMVNSNAGGACSVTVWWLYSNTSLVNFNVPTQCYSPPPPATQAGSSGTIETLDNRLYQASYLNGLLDFDTVGSYDWGDGNGQVAIVEWFKINASGPSVKQQGAFGTKGYWNFFPAMEQTSTGRVLFVFNSSGPSIDPSIWAVSACLCDTISLASGASYYGTSGTARWGDYQSAWLDPKLNSSGQYTSIWITGQYANATNSWGTRVGRIVPHS